DPVQRLRVVALGPGGVLFGEALLDIDDDERGAHHAWTKTGSQRTGKFTELAMKHFSWAVWCSRSAMATSLSAVMVMRGFSTTSVKRPPSLPSSSIVPSAWST